MDPEQPEAPRGNGRIIVASIIALLCILGAAFVVWGNPFAAPAGQGPAEVGFLKKNVPPISANDHIQGAQNPAVTIVEYADLESPQTKIFDTTMQQLLLTYPDTVAWVIRPFPLVQLHPDASILALGAECAAKEGGNDVFWRFVDAVFVAEDANGLFPMTSLTQTAVGLGLDGKMFDSCVASGTYGAYVTNTFNDAIAAGASGAPFSVLITKGGVQVAIPGAQPLENMKAAIDAALK